MKHSDKEIIGLGDWVPVKGFEGLYEISRFGREKNKNEREDVQGSLA